MADDSLIITARFWSKVDVGLKSQCWPWKGGTSDAGYGRFKLDGKLISPHRFAYEQLNGPIPEGSGYHGTVVRHQCDTPQCVNPYHLQIGSQLDNVRDMDAKGRRVNAQSRLLTPDQIEAIKRDPRTERAISAAYGISKTHVGDIRRGRRCYAQRKA